MKSNIQSKSQSEINQAIRDLSTDLLIFVADAPVWSYYQDQFERDISGKKILFWPFPGGEEGKTIEQYYKCLDFFLSQNMHRNAHLIAFGGGAVSDFAGFVAATLLRGISWSVIPTSLLSMVDASIGGKTGINSPHGKNLIGAFHLPENIWINSDYLRTLDKVEIASGKGEILKYCFISSGIYQAVSSSLELDAVIEACAQFKEEIVQRDFHEKNIRKCLNFGHTFGHAFEKLYDLPHGVSVALGIRYILEYHQDNSPIYLKRYRELIDLLQIEDVWNLYEKLVEDLRTNAQHRERFIGYLSKDKKRTENKRVDLVLLDGLGNPTFKSTDFKEISSIISEKLIG